MEREAVPPSTPGDTSEVRIQQRDPVQHTTDRKRIKFNPARKENGKV